MVYTVLREKDLDTDGYYYESKTSIIGIFDDEKKAHEFLKKATAHFHPDEKPIRGKYNKIGDTERVYGNFELEDRFWIDAGYFGEERLNEEYNR